QDYKTSTHTFTMSGQYDEIRIDDYNLYFHGYFKTFEEDILISGLIILAIVSLFVVIGVVVKIPKKLLTIFQIIMFILWGFVGIDILVKIVAYIFSNRTGIKELELVRNILILMAFTVFVTVKKSQIVNKRIA